MKSKTITDVLNSGSWGTVGPYSLSGARSLAERCGASYCLLTHSASAAYETLLRSFEPCHGDLIVTSSFSDPVLSLVPVCMGASPLFCDIGPDSPLISSASLLKTLSGAEAARVKAVSVCLAGGACPDLNEISDLCKNHGIPLILFSSDAPGIYYAGKPLTYYADAVVLGLDSRSALNIGNGGAVLTDNADIFTGACAYHHCGNSMDVGSKRKLNCIVGGDFRITEFQACLVAESIPETADILKNRQKAADEAIKILTCGYLVPVGANLQSTLQSLFFRYYRENNGCLSREGFIESMNCAGIGLRKGWPAMHLEPVFKSAYFRKMTGYPDCLTGDELHNSVSAGADMLRLDL